MKTLTHIPSLTHKRKTIAASKMSVCVFDSSVMEGPSDGQSYYVPDYRLDYGKDT